MTKRPHFLDYKGVDILISNYFHRLFGAGLP